MLFHVISLRSPLQYNFPLISELFQRAAIRHYHWTWGIDITHPRGHHHTALGKLGAPYYSVTWNVITYHQVRYRMISQGTTLCNIISNIITCDYYWYHGIVLSVKPLHKAIRKIVSGITKHRNIGSTIRSHFRDIIIWNFHLRSTITKHLQRPLFMPFPDTPSHISPLYIII